MCNLVSTSTSTVSFSAIIVGLKGAVLSVSGLTPLHIAVVNQNINLVQHLIVRGGDVVTPRVTGLYFRKRIGGLIYYGKSAMMQVHGEPHSGECLQKFGLLKGYKLHFPPKFPGEHILSFAACSGNEDIISMIIEAGASTRVQDYRGELHLFHIETERRAFCDICVVFLPSSRLHLHMFPL